MNIFPSSYQQIKVKFEPQSQQEATNETDNRNKNVFGEIQWRMMSSRVILLPFFFLSF